jgi:hypothetical protein
VAAPNSLLHRRILVASFAGIMSPMGLGCVKTQTRAKATEETFVRIVDTCTNISQRVRFQSA